MVVHGETELGMINRWQNEGKNPQPATQPAASESHDAAIQFLLVTNARHLLRSSHLSDMMFFVVWSVSYLAQWLE